MTIKNFSVEKKMKFYFAGSIRGAEDKEILEQNHELITYLNSIGTVLTEHVGDINISGTGQEIPDKQIHDRDMRWIEESNAVIANVSIASLGVGYEIRRCIELNKPTLCLYKCQSKKLSAMIAGSSVPVRSYENVSDAIEIIYEFLSGIK